MEYILFILFIIIFIWVSDILDSRESRRRIREYDAKYCNHASKPFVVPKSPSHSSFSSIPDSTPKSHAPSYLYVNKQTYLASNEWQVLRKSTLKRDLYTCQSCGVTDVPLEVHHLTYQRLGKERPSDVVSLCRICHQSLHDKAKLLHPHDPYGYSYNYPLSILRS